jgi:hypothetical protein
MGEEIPAADGGCDHTAYDARGIRDGPSGGIQRTGTEVSAAGELRKRRIKKNTGII